MKRKLISVLAIICMVVTLMPVMAVSGAAEAYAAKTPTEAEIKEAFVDIGFAASVSGGEVEFDDDEDVAPGVAFWFLCMNGRLEPYFDDTTWCYELTLEQYMDEMSKAFANYDDEQVINWLEKMGYYDSASGNDRVSIYSGGLGDFWAWEPLGYTSDGNIYTVTGLFLYGGRETGDVQDGDEEFYDYWWYTSVWQEGGEEYSDTYEMYIENAIAVNMEYTADGFKILSYEEPDYYTYDGVTYAMNEETNAFDQSYKVDLSYNSATYNGNYKNPEVTVTDRYGKVLKEGNAGQYTVQYRNNLNPGIAKVDVEIEYGNYDAEVVKEFAIKLKAPGVTLSNVASSGKIKVAWNAVDYADEYEVYRATSKSGTYSKIKTTTSLSYTDTSAVAEKTYYYKVKAVYKDNTAANSAYSSVKSRTCDLAKVEGLSISNVASSGKPKLTWDKVSYADEYEVYRATSKSGTYTKVKTTDNLYWTDTTATAEKTYYYKVKAVSTKTEANGAYSSVKSRTCDLAKVTGVAASNVASSGKPKVTWNKVSYADEYEVYRATSKSGTYKKVKTTDNLYWTDTTAVAEKTYYYKVKAVSSKTEANGALSGYVSRLCDLAKPTVKVAVNSKGDPKVTWGKVSYADKYEVYRATSKSGTYKEVKTTTNLYYTDTDVKPSKTYYYKVKAISTASSSANSAFSAVKSCTAK